MTTINTQRISLGKLDNAQDVATLIKHLVTLYSGQIVVTTGSGAPTAIPTKISAQYLDTANKNVYVAVGTSSLADWIKVS